MELNAPYVLTNVLLAMLEVLALFAQIILQEMLIIAAIA
jgi:hypothetical protein